MKKNLETQIDSLTILHSTKGQWIVEKSTLGGKGLVKTEYNRLQLELTSFIHKPPKNLRKTWRITEIIVGKLSFLLDIHAPA